ncbi:hypothetical protein H6G36_25410 [Anabaena minutissima FACHB-250]|nr:hypothetical protein [Anabaena minutissima FACHB-250]
MQLVAEISGGNVLRKPKRGLAVNKIKIKYGRDFRIELITNLPPDNNETKILRCVYKDEPRAEFDKALDIILKTLIIRCKLDPKEWGDAKITEVNLKDTEEGVNATIVSCLELSEETKAIARIEEKNISYELKAEIDNLIAEIEDYVSGKRRQTTLFDEQ